MATGIGNLPNPSMSFSPFAILTADELNDIVENIESLATGTGIGDGSVTAQKIATGALFLGIATGMSYSGTTSTTTDFSGTQLTITIPTGTRGLLLLTTIIASGSTTSLMDWFIREGSTSLGNGRNPVNGTGGWSTTITGFAYVPAPSAGSHTYKLSGANATSAGTITATSVLLAVLL